MYMSNRKSLALVCFVFALATVNITARATQASSTAVPLRISNTNTMMEPVTPDWVPQCAGNTVPFESQSWWMPDFGHLHIGFCAPQNQTISGKYTFNVRLTLYKNPGTITRLQANFDKDPYVQTNYLNLQCPITDICSWDQQITIDTTKAPYDGWHQIRIRAQVNEPTGQLMATSNYIPVSLKNGKPVSAPFGNINNSSDYIAGRGWYTNAGYATGIVFDPRAASEKVSGIYKVKVRSAASDNPQPVSRFIVKLDGTHTSPGIGVYDGTEQSKPLELNIDTTKLSNGWHSLITRTEMAGQPGTSCAVCSGQPQMLAGVGKIWFYVQN